MEYHRNNKANGQEGPSSLAVGEGYIVQLYNVNNMLYMGGCSPSVVGGQIETHMDIPMFADDN